MIQDNDEYRDRSQALDVRAKGPMCALTARHRRRGCGSISRGFSWSHDHLHDVSDGEVEDPVSTWARPASPVHRSHRPFALVRDPAIVGDGAIVASSGLTKRLEPRAVSGPARQLPMLFCTVPLVMADRSEPASSLPAARGNTEKLLIWLEGVADLPRSATGGPPRSSRSRAGRGTALFRASNGGGRRPTNPARPSEPRPSFSV
jgi:hypothetical protein